MDQAIEQGNATKVNVDYKDNSNSGDKMGDHFVVVTGKTESVSNGEVTNTTYRYFDPGTEHHTKGTSSNNVFKIDKGRLLGTHINNGKQIVVSSIRPTR